MWSGSIGAGTSSPESEHTVCVPWCHGLWILQFPLAMAKWAAAQPGSGKGNGEWARSPGLWWGPQGLLIIALPLTYLGVHLWNTNTKADRGTFLKKMKFAKRKGSSPKDKEERLPQSRLLCCSACSEPGTARSLWLWTAPRCWWRRRWWPGVRTSPSECSKTHGNCWTTWWAER